MQQTKRKPAAGDPTARQAAYDGDQPQDNTAAADCNNKPFLNGRAWRESGAFALPNAQFKVWAYMLARLNKDGKAWPGRKRIREEIGMAHGAADAARKALVENGWLVPVGSEKSGTVVYRCETGGAARKSGRVPENRLGGATRKSARGATRKSATEVLHRSTPFEEQDLNPSPDGAEEQICDQEKAPSPSKEKRSQSAVEIEQSIEMTETVALPAPSCEALVLSAPPGKDMRHQSFKAQLVAFFESHWNLPCPWGPAEGMQLKKFLAENPRWDEAMFIRALTNYGQSHDPTPGERPCKFLARIHNYSVEPVDKFSRSFRAPIITGKMQNQMRTAVNFAESRLRRQGALHD